MLQQRSTPDPSATGLPPVHPLILCGGSGTRLWPVSRKSFPKPFVSLLGEESLFQSTARRLAGEAYHPPLVMTGDPYRFIVTEQLAAIGSAPTAILIEPEGRNTAPAILAAALWLRERDPHALMLAAPSDHLIPDHARWEAAVAAAVPRALAGDIVMFGINPTGPATGYGYIECEDITEAENRPLPIARFTEKPDRAQAAAMIAEGRCFWNAGMFLFSVDSLIRACETHAPDMCSGVRAAVNGAEPDLNFIRLSTAPWQSLRAQAVDHAIMEKAANLAVLPYDGKWCDLGDWNSIGEECVADEDGNVCSAGTDAIDCSRSFLRSESDDIAVVGIGLDNIIVVATPDAVLVADRTQSQRVGEGVARLKSRAASQAENAKQDRRPWGWFESIASGDRFQVKRLVVKPGGSLSLQSHVHRAEHWIVVGGTARVTIDGEVSLVTENQSVYVPLGAVHRLENPGKLPVVLIEVQTGNYLGEDDITRYEDIYSRR